MKFTAKKSVGISNAVSIANDARLHTALRTGDRVPAIEALEEVGAKMKAQTKFKNIKVHVHTNDNHSFVRIWKLDKYGDDLSSFRHSIVQVNKTIKPVNTFELGKAGLSLRSVVPIVDNEGQHLGSLEFMQGLNSVAKAFDKRKEGFLFLMDKRLVSVEQFKDVFTYKENYIISQKFVRMSFLDDAENINLNKLLVDKSYISDKYLYTYVNVKDFRGKTLGIAITGAPLDKVDMAVNDAQTLIYEALLIIILLVAVILIAIVMLVSKIINKPIQDFQEGLLGFFSYLNKESNTAQKLVVNLNDEIGQMTQIVNENIEKTKLLIEQDDNLINEVKDAVTKVNDGYINQTVNAKTSNSSLEELKTIFNDMLQTISTNVASDVNKLDVALEKFANLDFRVSIEDNGKTAQGLNQLAETINDMLIDSKKNGLILQNYSDTLTTNVEKLNTSTNQQAASLEETAASIEEISSLISRTAERAQELQKLALHTKSSDNVGKALANKTVTAMDEINEATSAIEEAITIIDQIAFQTNILSLNAAVEAATAGEAGKGFAVVAGEVRNLAGRSAEAASEIKKLVEQAKDKADEGKQISADMIKEYDVLDNDIAQTTTLVEEVSESAKEQLSGIHQINSAIIQLDQATQENAKMAAETNAVALHIDKIAHRVVDDANTKEFNGKDDIDISIELQEISVSSSSVKTTSKEQGSNISVDTPKSVNVRADDKDDEWDSF